MHNIYFYLKSSTVNKNLIDFFNNQNLEDVVCKELTNSDNILFDDIVITEEELLVELKIKPTFLILFSHNLNLSIDSYFSIINFPIKIKDLGRDIDFFVNKAKQIKTFSNFAFLYEEDGGWFFSNTYSIDNQKFRVKEALFLKTLLEHYPKEAPRSELLKEVWGFADGINTNTLETHLSSVRKKLLLFNINIIKNDTGYKLDFF